MRRVNDVITGGEKARGTVILAFDFAVNKVGIDLESYDLWKDYIDFYKSWTPGSNYELQQKNDSIRKLYKRCLVIPNAKIETMWADYRKWENELSSPNVASKFIADLSTAYMEVRPWNTEWHNATESLLRRKLFPCSPHDDQAGVVKHQQSLWFRWIDLEKQNKLNLPDPALRYRVEYVYRRAISLLPFVPEIWFRLGQYLQLIDEDNNKSACINLFADGLALNPTSYLLAFQLSELYEKEGDFVKARTVYDDIISLLSKKHEGVRTKIDELIADAAEKAKPVKKQVNENGYNSNDDEDEGAPAPVVIYTEAQAAELEKYETKLADLAKCVTLLYIKLMSLCKRSQGIKEIRAVFKQRKNFKAMGYQFYVVNALHEYYSDNKKTADKVFDLAMKSFSKDGGFLYAYLDYLILSNSIESLKVVFEVAVTSLLKEIASDKETLEIATNNIVLHRTSAKSLKKSQFYTKKIIKRYINFASSYLDLDTVTSLSKRFCQYFPETDGLALFSSRYTLGSYNAIAEYDLANAHNLESDLEDLDDLDEQRPKRRRLAEPAEANNTSTSSGRTDTHKSLPPTPSMAVAQQTQQQLHGFVGNEIYNLLQGLPNAGCFGPKNEHLFNSAKLVELFTHVVLPGEQ